VLENWYGENSDRRGLLDHGWFRHWFTRIIIVMDENIINKQTFKLQDEKSKSTIDSTVKLEGANKN
jgi:hypothetical protein